MNVIKGNKENDKILSILIGMIGISIPYSQVFNTACIGLLFIYSFKYFDKTHFITEFKKHSIAMLFLLYYFILIFGILISDDTESAIDYVVRDVVFLVFPLIFVNLSEVISKKTTAFGVLGLVIGVTINLIVIHYRIIGRVWANALPLRSLLTKFVRVSFVEEGIVAIHPPYFGLLVVFSMVYVLYVDTNSKNLFLKGIRVITILYFLIALYGISSFMSLVLVGILFILYILHLVISKDIKTLIYLLCGCIFVTIIIINTNYRKALSTFPGESLIGRIEWSFNKGKGDTSRPDNWRSVIQVIKDNPVFGVGSDGGIDQLQEYREESSEAFRDRHNAHNNYLEIFLRHGIIGIIMYILILYNLIQVAMKAKDKFYSHFILIFLIVSLTESYFVRQIGVVFFTFYATLFYTFYRNNILEKIDNEKSIST